MCGSLEITKGVYLLSIPMMRVISATCVVYRRLRVSYAFNDQYILKNRRRISFKRSIYETQNKDHLYECEGAASMRIDKTKFSKALMKHQDMPKAKTGTTVRTKLCLEIFCVILLSWLTQTPKQFNVSRPVIS